MKVEPTQGPKAAKPDGAQEVGSASHAKGPGWRGDGVQISSKAQFITWVREVSKSEPMVRSDRVAQVKDQIAHQRLDTSPQSVAQALLKGLSSEHGKD